VIYVRWKAGPAPQGFGNFTWPVIGWIEKWGATLTGYAREPEYRWLTTTTLLALIALTVQAIYFLRRGPAMETRRRLENPWWRAGICGVAMMAMLGTAVWEGHPGAATRVLLPMSVAFAVLAVRERARWGWIAGGSLTVFSGVLALWHVPESAGEFTAGRFAGGSYLVRPQDGWYGVERSSRATWDWSSGRATVAFDIAPRATAPVHVRLKVRAIAPRTIEIRDGAAVVWRGEVRTDAVWIDFNATPRERGRLVLELRSEAPPVRESDEPGARALSFALYRAELE
jgi:hypothetical protein